MHVGRLGSLAAAAALVLTVGCAPTPGAPDPGVPAPPTISSFAPAKAPGPSPALVTLRWNVSDPNGDDLTCQIDVDGDAIPDLTIRSCQGVGSRNVTLQAVGGASTVHNLTLTVNDGIEVAGVVGTATASTSVTIAPGSGDPFNITLAGVDGLDPDSAAAFLAAAQRWQQAVVTGRPDVNGATLGCTSPDGSPLPTLIDDVLIYVKIAPIDGPGSILGQAGPSCVTSSNELTIVGEMTFDSDDVATMKSRGTFGSVILHEMGHVLGIGTLWDTSFMSGTRHLITGAGGANPRFIGPAASAEWEVLNSTDRTGVPVENTGGPGTADSHWRESIFGNELMTGWINTPAPMSAMTIASLADLGYSVDTSTADSFSLGGAAARAADSGSSATNPLGTTAELTVLRPRLQVSTSG